MTFSTTEIILGLLVLLLAAVAIMLWMRSRTSARLKSTFGPEYSRTVREVGSEGKAEKVLAARQKRVASYTIKPLPPEMRDHFNESWKRVQAQFVDDPAYAVTRADDLLGEVMNTRGYPVKDFEQQAEDLSVNHPRVAQNYRTAHEIALRHGDGTASTEDLRKAMIHYRALFEDLTTETASERPQEKREEIHDAPRQ